MDSRGNRCAAAGDAEFHRDRATELEAADRVRDSAARGIRSANRVQEPIEAVDAVGVCYCDAELASATVTSPISRCAHDGSAPEWEGAPARWGTRWGERAAHCVTDRKSVV